MGAPFIVLDFDDTVANLSGHIHNGFKTVLGLDVPVSQWHSYSLPKVYGVGLDDCMRVFHEHDILRKSDIYPESAKAFHLAKERGFRVGILSARGWHQDALEITLASLAEESLAVDRIELVRPGESKAIKAKVFGHISLVVDDHHDNLQQLAPHSDYLALIDRPWNADVSAFQRHANVLDAIQAHVSLLDTGARIS